MDEITLEPDPVWTGRFEDQRERIRDRSSEGLLGVFHVGSTAVPDLAAKPMLDVLAVYDGYDPARNAAAALVDDGYDLRKDEPDWIQLTRSDTYDVFVHLRPRDATAWRDQLVVREYLRENREARREYERVKRAAATEHADDPEAYTAAKDEIVRSLEQRAYEEGYADRLPGFAR